MKRHAAFKILAGTSLVLLLVPGLLLAQGGWRTYGSLEGHLGVISDTLHDGGFNHAERLVYGITNQGSDSRLQTCIALGGLLRQSTRFEVTEFAPEYRLQSAYRLAGRTEIGIFSYNQLRDPLGLAIDTLTQQEQVLGLRLATGFGDRGRLQVSLGQRLYRGDREFSQQFIGLRLNRRILGMNVGLSGEHALYDEVQTDLEDRSRFHLQWTGKPLPGLTWTAFNTYQTRNDLSYWRIYQRASYRLGERSKVWAHLNQGMQDYRGSTLLRRTYDLNYRRSLGKAFLLDVLTEGERVTPDSGDIAFHWRSTLLGLGWHLGPQDQIHGAIHAGYKESYQFGKGLDLRLDTEEIFSLINRGSLGLTLKDQLSGEFFQRLDDDGDFLMDLDHRLQLLLELKPTMRATVGNRLTLINHLGSDLAFSTDTLRNAVTHDLYFQRHLRRTRWSINHFTILDLGEESDTRLHLNARVNRMLGHFASFNLQTMYRYSSDRYPEYIWLNGGLKFHNPAFDWALELQTAGPPDEAFEHGLQVWMRFMRQL